MEKLLDKLEKAAAGSFDKDLATQWMSQRESAFKSDLQSRQL